MIVIAGDSRVFLHNGPSTIVDRESSYNNCKMPSSVYHSQVTLSWTLNFEIQKVHNIAVGRGNLGLDLVQPDEDVFDEDGHQQIRLGWWRVGDVAHQLVFGEWQACRGVACYSANPVLCMLLPDLLVDLGSAVTQTFLP